MKKNVEICRAEHEDKKKEPSFDGSFFLSFAWAINYILEMISTSSSPMRP